MNQIAADGLAWLRRDCSWSVSVDIKRPIQANTDGIVTASTIGLLFIYCIYYYLSQKWSNPQNYITGILSVDLT